MGQLIDDLLELSRAGRVGLEKGTVNLGKLVREVRQECLQGMGEREIAWKLGPLPEVRADRGLLRLVLINLVSNALKFTRIRQQAEIEIGSESGGGNEEVVIFVRDNGVGFDMKYIEKLFGVFQRLHSSEEFEGTGIGLANVRRTIHRHGGRVWAESTAGEGATFFFSLPKTKGSSHEASSKQGTGSYLICRG
jgi:light-regulated signal transduction histidine kinase (bacteriophytochrome)